jgi:hypothetical protein
VTPEDADRLSDEMAETIGAELRSRLDAAGFKVVSRKALEELVILAGQAAP